MSVISKAIRKVKNTSCSVVIVAGGNSSRMGENKLFMDLLGVPVLARTLLAFDSCDFVKEIVLVTRESDLNAAAQLCRQYSIEKCSKVIIGGKNRVESALNGLCEIDRNAKVVLIHDGARPLVTEKVIYDVVHNTVLYKCAAAAVATTDTVKEQNKGIVVRTLNRSSLVSIQTPQGFYPDIIKAALTKAVKDGIEYTDDSAAVEALGIPVRITEGSHENIKITHPTDIPVAVAIIENRGY